MEMAVGALFPAGVGLRQEAHSMEHENAALQSLKQYRQDYDAAETATTYGASALRGH
jgi:hypothetical protein